MIILIVKILQFLKLFISKYLIMAILNSNLGVKNICRTPKDFSSTPGGTRTPGWEPLV